MMQQRRRRGGGGEGGGGKMINDFKSFNNEYYKMYCK